MIKLSDVHQQLEENYLPERISHYSVPQIVCKAFPNVTGKSRSKHIAGITPVHTVTMEGSQVPGFSDWLNVVYDNEPGKSLVKTPWMCHTTRIS